MTNRRTVLRNAALLSSAAIWHKPIINAIALPAHAQTSFASLSCTMVDASDNPLADGAGTDGNVTITYSSSPPRPGETVSWVGRCNGVDDFAVQNDTLDANGELIITVSTLDLCSGGPPNSGDVILHNAVLDSSGSGSNCSYVYRP